MPLSELKLAKKYRRKLNNEMVRSFFAPCIEEAQRYDRASGYFSSAVFEVARESFCSFF